MTRGRVLPLGAAVLGGILFFLGYAGFDQFYLEWVCLLPLFWAIRDQRPGRAFLLGWLAGLVGHAGGFYWVIGMFQVFAGLPWPLAALGLLLLAAANGLLMGVWAWAIRLIALRTRWSQVWVAPVLWTALEKYWPEVFPNYLGASQYQLPLLLTQIADLVGILGVSFLVVFINASLWSIVSGCLERRRSTWRPAVALAAVLAAVLGYGAFRVQSVERQVAAAEQLSVGLIQTNQGGTAKYYDPAAIFREHQAMTVALAQVQPVDLTVWPEGICEIALASSREGQVPAFAGMKTPILWGSVVKEVGPGSEKFYNTAVLTDTSGRILGTYDKSILVPFGEYIPFGDIFPRLYSWSPYTSRFWPGTSEEPLRLGKHRLSVSICYEDIFPGKIRALMRSGREGHRPDVMFNLTNDSWYGKSTEPVEHLALASFRSIENRRALVRVTNTGISAIVDPVGRIVSRTGIWTKETLVSRVPMLKGTTVYTQYGDLLGWLCILLAAWCIGQALSMAGKGGGSQVDDDPADDDPATRRRVPAAKKKH